MKSTPLATLPTDKAYLHFEATRIGEEKVQVDYELVIPLDEVDCRGTFDHKGAVKRPASHRVVWLDRLNSKRIPLGRTAVGTGNGNYPFSRFPGEDDEIDLPFRDGAHCQWDNDKLGGLPIIYTTSGRHWLLTPCGETGRKLL